MVRVKLKIGRDVILNRPFNGIDIFARRDATAIAKPEDMRIHGLRGLAPPHIQDHIGRLTAHTGQGLQRSAGIGNLAAELIHQNLRGLHDVLGLLAIKTNRLDVIRQRINPEVEHFLRRIRHFEQRGGGFVNTLVGRLRGQCHSHNERIGVDVVKFALWFGVPVLKARENLADRGVIELLGQFCHGSFCLARKPQTRERRNNRVAQPRLHHYLTFMEHSDRYHYQVIRRALDAIDDAGAPLSLEDLAKRMDMSPAHFQRVFSRWVGVSPKRYQQYLRLDHAKTLLAENFTTLATADAVGLSGSGRLHDLFLKWEAMSPGDYAKGGAGLVIRWGCFESTFGPVIAMATDRGICGMGFLSEQTDEAAYADLANRWPNATFQKDPDAIRDWVDAALSMKGEAHLHLIGAPFQLKVWEALLSIPSGHVTTYSEIAQSIGNPKAVRAVGTAVGRNPVSWLIPCHRALRKSGGLGGYHWGLPVKRAMLAWESAREDAG